MTACLSRESLQCSFSKPILWSYPGSSFSIWNPLARSGEESAPLVLASAGSDANPGIQAQTNLSSHEPISGCCQNKSHVCLLCWPSSGNPSVQVGNVRSSLTMNTSFGGTVPFSLANLLSLMNLSQTCNYNYVIITDFQHHALPDIHDMLLQIGFFMCKDWLNYVILEIWPANNIWILKQLLW